jgi:DNA-binding transcriptional LysR family regulator
VRDEYEALVRTIEAGGLSAAARDLGLSPALVSKRLARLEDRLGVRLIERTTRKLEPTEAGRQFFERARAILDAIAEAESQVSGRLAPASGLLRVSAPTSFGRRHLAPHLKTFLDAHPELTLELNLSDAFVDLDSEGVDLAIRIAPQAEVEPDAIRLAPNRRLLCAAPAYLAARGTPTVLADLRGHAVIAAATQTSWRLEGPEGPVVFRARSTLRTNSSEVVREAVLTGLGVGLRSTWDVGEALASGALQVILPQYRGAADVAIYALRSRRRRNAPPVRALIAFLEGLYGPQPYWDQPAGV